MRTNLVRLLAAGGILAATSLAQATPVVLAGNYLKVGISDYGTLGSDGSTEPGILHDPTGTANFYPGGIANDYLTPGTPHEGFSVNSDQTGFIQNDNTGYQSFGPFGSPSLLTGAAANGYANAASWTGSNDQMSITHSYFFNPNDERILVKTTITANQDLTNLAFARSEDPDPDVNRFGSYDTNNQRGNSLYGATDFVGSAGANTGLTIGLLNGSGNTYTHNTVVDYSCCSNIDPNLVLFGDPSSAGDVSFGDYSINMAWEIGSLTKGSSATLQYYYVFGDKIDTVGTPPVPEPETYALMFAGLATVLAIRRRKA